MFDWIGRSSSSILLQLCMNTAAERRLRQLGRRSIAPSSRAQSKQFVGIDGGSNQV